jgi:hypothetical protein
MRKVRATRAVRGKPSHLSGSLGGSAGGGVPIPSVTKRVTGVSGTGAVGTVTTATS